MQKNPREGAGILSVIFFCWTFPIFRNGLKKQFSDEDGFGTLSEHRSSVLGNALEKAWEMEMKNKSRPSLLKVLTKLFFRSYVIFGLLYFFDETLRLCRVIALGKLIYFFSPNDTEETLNEAYIYGGAIVAITFLSSIINHNYMLGVHHIGMKMRVACCSLIYRKSLRLSSESLSKITAGQLVNLLSNDVCRFDTIVEHLIPLVMAPFLVVITMCLTYVYLGWTSCIGICVFLIFIPLQRYLAQRISVYRFRIALITDERVRLMNEIISGIKVIKLYAWERAFEKLITSTRSLEMKDVKHSSYLKGILLSFVVFTLRFALFISILSLILDGKNPTSYYVFLSAAFYDALRVKMTISIPSALCQLAEVNVTIQRICLILLGAEKQENTSAGIDENPTTNCKLGHETNTTKKIQVMNASARWSSSERQTLSKINFEADDKQLIIVVGSVGSGKTSLMQAILNEIPLNEGCVVVNGKISYASQEPWLFRGSVKENILLGQKLDATRYKDVVQMCELQRDLSLLPNGDETLVGEKGVTLSGGQKSRINLARAIYNVADIYLLDDPLSALDAQVGKAVFENCILDHLKSKTVVLATHQLQYLPYATHIVIMENGEIIADGSFEDLCKVGHFERIVTEEKQNDGPKNVEADSSVGNKGCPYTDENEVSCFGSISWHVYKKYLQSGGGAWYSLLVLSTFVITQTIASGSDYFLTMWVNAEENKLENNEDTQLLPTNAHEESYIYLYVGLISITVIASFLRSYFLFGFCLRAAKMLHNNMFSNIVHSSLCFFNKNPSGRILNRFSKDLGEVDEIIPPLVMDTLQLGLSAIGMVTMSGISNPWLYVAILFFGAILLVLRKFYLNTSREIKRMEGVKRSPVYTHINSSLEGITTIRAFRVQDAFKNQFDDHQDVHSSVFYTFLACTRAFGFWVDSIVSLYVGIVTYSFFLNQNRAPAGNVGLALTQSLGMAGVLQWGMRQWGNLENQMTAVERIVQYSDSERGSPSRIRLRWINQGKIDFRSVSLRYHESEPYVLKDVNISINSKEKIGIVGRTGSGKSSLINALFDLNVIEGNVFIDDINTKTIGTQNLRSQISIIPQEPVLFSSTLRRNIDPFDEQTDVDLWHVLEEVELKKVVETFPLGLDHIMCDGGVKLSVGQRQLLCLARAIVRNNKILVLDEATSNVDRKTDTLIQNTIRKKFRHCTVLTIAHRLHTVMDSDKLLVMDDGKVMEFNHPFLLLQNENGILFNLANQSGEWELKQLCDTARISYQLRSQETT